MKKRHRKSVPVILEQDEGLRVLDQPSKTCKTGRRNYAILKTMLNLGLRVSEVTNLCETDIDLDHQTLRILHGKGDKDRLLSIPENLLPVLRKWEEERPRSDYYFSTLRGTQLSTRYLREAVGRYAMGAGIKKRISPHTLRHSFATQYIRENRPVVQLQRILGHADLKTTMNYINLTNKDMKSALEGFEGF
jgi:integrase/recombinase XerD